MYKIHLCAVRALNHYNHYASILLIITILKVRKGTNKLASKLTINYNYVGLSPSQMYPNQIFLTSLEILVAEIKIFSCPHQK